MSKKSASTKSAQPAQNKLGLSEKSGAKTVLIKLRPWRGVGGIGGPGTEAYVTPEYARELVETGYADILERKPAPVIPSEVAEDSNTEEA